MEGLMKCTLSGPIIKIQVAFVWKERGCRKSIRRSTPRRLSKRIEFTLMKLRSGCDSVTNLMQARSGYALSPNVAETNALSFKPGRCHQRFVVGNGQTRVSNTNNDRTICRIPVFCRLDGVGTIANTKRHLRRRATLSISLYAARIDCVSCGATQNQRLHRQHGIFVNSLCQCCVPPHNQHPPFCGSQHFEHIHALRL